MPGFASIFQHHFKEAISQNSALSKAEREAVSKAYERALENEPPPRLVLIGEAGVGKSTTINALFNAGQPVGHTKATTDQAYVIPVHAVRGSKGVLEIVDVPGLGDDIKNYAAYLDLYLRVLADADAVLWVHPATDRMVHLIQLAVRDIFVQRRPDLLDRLVFGLSKADEMHPGDWNPSANLPSQAQLDALEERAGDFTEKIAEAVPDWSGSPIAYSSERRYNLTALFRAMIEAVPERRRWVFEERMDLADFEALVDGKLLASAKATMLEKVRDLPTGRSGRPLDPSAGPGRRPGGSRPAGSQQGGTQQAGPDVARALDVLSDDEWRQLTSNRALFMRFLKSTERDGPR